MQITIDNLPGLRALLQRRILALTEPELLLDLARRQRDRILQRTAAGVDLDAQRFRPYAAAWRRHRQLHGRPPTVNLFYTGAMLTGMIPRLSSRGVSLGFADDVQARKASANQATRPFFGFAAGDPPAILQDLLEATAHPDE